MDQISAFVKALDDLEKSASFAQKYGPYFFAVALLVVTPFIARAVFDKSIARTDKKLREEAYADFRLYFRSTLAVGIFCVIAGVGWWLYDSYREGARTLQTVTDLKGKLQNFEATMKTMNFTAFGVIGPGLKAHDVFYRTDLNGELTIALAKLPIPLPNSEASWLFVILSDKQLKSPMDFSVGYASTEGGDSPKVPQALMPMHIDLAQNNRIYSFSLEGQGGRASIKPTR
ncbi:MAG: hypothetical protein ACTHLO_05890 [Pseudolabrys sp.]